MQEAIDAGKLDARAPVDAGRWSRPACSAAPQDGVQLLGNGEIKAKVDVSRWRRFQVGGRRGRKGGRHGEDLLEGAEAAEEAHAAENGDSLIAPEAAERPVRARVGGGRELRMASAAEQLAANLNFGAFAKAEELKKRIWFTLGALLVYRLGTYIPMPGIDPQALATRLSSSQAGGILGMFNMFSGGAHRAHGDLRARTSCRTSRPRSSCS